MMNKRSRSSIIRRVSGPKALVSKKLSEIKQRTAQTIPKLSTVLRQHKKILVYTACTLGLAALLTTVIYFSVPATAQFSETEIAVNEPIGVSFSHPVRESVKYDISPSTQGSWHVSKDTFGGITRVAFQPKQPLYPHTAYRVTLTHVHSLLGLGTPKNQVISITTQRLQQLTVLSPAVGTPMPIDSTVTVRMARPNNNVRKLMLVSGTAKLASPTPTSTNDKQFTWHFAQPLQQGKTYTLELKDMNRPSGQQLIQTISFTTVSEPQVTQATDTDHLYPNQPIIVTFDHDMLPNTKDFIFSCTGTGKWQDPHTYTYMPTPLPAATTCTYTVLRGSRDKQGGIVEADHTYTTSSPGAAFVSSANPHGSGAPLSSKLSITFDQPVDHTSAQNAFSITPSVAGTTTWDGNTLIFKPSGLAYQTTYTAAIRSGVIAIYGLPSTRAFSSSFTTAVQTVKLTVPAYKQQYALSCEESSLRMALAYRGIMVNDMTILQAVGYSPEARNTATNSWQDPYKMYVGDVNGKEDVTGWGTYGPPIAAAAKQLGRNATYVSGITAQQISQAIHDDNPVVLWGVMSGQTPRIDSWNTTSDGVVSVVANAHVRTVYGVVGNASSPIGFYLHDPIYGDTYWSTAQLTANMTASGQISTQGVIVY